MRDACQFSTQQVDLVNFKIQIIKLLDDKIYFKKEYV